LSEVAGGRELGGSRAGESPTKRRRRESATGSR
jgi:hypothetical protein